MTQAEQSSATLTISSLSDLNGVLRRMSVLKRRLVQADARHAERIAKLNKAHEDHLAPEKTEYMMLIKALASFVSENRDLVFSGKLMQIFAAAILKLNRSTKGSLVVAGEERIAIAMLERSPKHRDLVKIEKSLRRDAIKRRLVDSAAFAKRYGKVFSVTRGETLGIEYIPGPVDRKAGREPLTETIPLD